MAAPSRAAGGPGHRRGRRLAEGAVTLWSICTLLENPADRQWLLSLSSSRPALNLSGAATRRVIESGWGAERGHRLLGRECEDVRWSS